MTPSKNETQTLQAPWLKNKKFNAIRNGRPLSEINVRANIAWSEIYKKSIYDYYIRFWKLSYKKLCAQNKQGI